MNPRIGWGLAVLGVALGWRGYGWPGVAMAVSVIVFWLLLQFSRSLRVMRRAAAAPLGRTDSTVMLQARLVPGLLMLQLVSLAGSLGRRVADSPETWAWRDASDAVVEVELDARGRCARWRLRRPDDAGPPPA
jgi:hypothetical protein